MTYTPLIPHTNVTLTAISGTGYSEDNDQSATSGSAKWSGSLGVYLGEEIIVDTSRGELNELTQGKLTVPMTVGVVSPDDSVTFTENATVKTRKVRNVREFDVVGLMHLHLWDA